MRMSKFFTILIICTMAAILYVRQQVEATKLGYQINQQQATMDEMLDQRQMLLYNVYNLKSPENLQESFSKNYKKSDEFKIAGNRQIMVLSGAKAGSNAVVKKSAPRLANIFGFTSLAEAKTQD